MGKVAEQADSITDVVQNGAYLVLLNVPPNTEFGIDWKFWRTGQNFRGVKYIPSGPHYAYFSSTHDKDVGPRFGFFFYSTIHQLIVKEWKVADETFETIEENSDNWLRVKESLEEVSAYLGPYPQENFRTWISLAYHISPEVIKALSPSTDGIIYSVAQYQSPGSNSQQRADDQRRQLEQKRQKEARLDSAVSSQSLSLSEESGSTRSESASGSDITSEAASPRKRHIRRRRRSRRSASTRLAEYQLKHQLAHLKEVPGSRVRFTKIPRQPFIPEGGQLSSHIIDKSYTLEQVLLLKWGMPINPMPLLGELQFAFVAFILGNLYDGFRQWKRLVFLICNSDAAIRKYPAFYSAFISAIYHQLTHIPEDFLTDIVTNNNLIAVSLHALFSNCGIANNGGDAAVAPPPVAGVTGMEEIQFKAKGLNQFCEEHFHWDLRADLEDEAPVVVDLGDNY